MAKNKAALHPRNPHSSYNFDQLAKSHPPLRDHIQIKYDHQTIDFSDTAAVRALNTALLKKHYDVQFWSIPENYLCPGIPGRANYIHFLADLLGELKGGKVPLGRSVRALDVGTGANVAYPIIGIKEYRWQFVGSEIDKDADDESSF
ncbi:MAG: RlmF-related methyltransferase [Planctomycetota bacterium]|nr:RlmF-related methyltransferase [Planctomycetota bacterium]